jgi:hypothetical protein
MRGHVHLHLTAIDLFCLQVTQQCSRGRTPLSNRNQLRCRTHRVSSRTHSSITQQIRRSIPRISTAPVPLLPAPPMRPRGAADAADPHRSIPSERVQRTGNRTHRRWVRIRPEAYGPIESFPASRFCQSSSTLEAPGYRQPIPIIAIGSLALAAEAELFGPGTLLFPLTRISSCPPQQLRQKA